MHDSYSWKNKHRFVYSGPIAKYILVFKKQVNLLYYPLKRPISTDTEKFILKKRIEQGKQYSVYANKW